MIIVGRQVRIAGGELDRVAVDGETIVFVEVKTRRSDSAGHPAEAVTDEKRRKLTRCALAFLRRHDLLEYAARFDVIAVTWSPADSAFRGPRIEHLRNAFAPTGTWQMFV
jgi:putative endonuclease